MKITILLAQDVPPSIRATIEADKVPTAIVYKQRIYVQLPLTHDPTVYRKARSVYYLDKEIGK